MDILEKYKNNMIIWRQIKQTVFHVEWDDLRQLIELAEASIAKGDKSTSVEVELKGKTVAIPCIQCGHNSTFLRWDLLSSLCNKLWRKMSQSDRAWDDMSADWKRVRDLYARRESITSWEFMKIIQGRLTQTEQLIPLDVEKIMQEINKSTDRLVSNYKKNPVQQEEIKKILSKYWYSPLVALDVENVSDRIYSAVFSMDDHEYDDDVKYPDEKSIIKDILSKVGIGTKQVDRNYLKSYMPYVHAPTHEEAKAIVDRIYGRDTN